MKENEAILERQKTRIRYKNKDMDLMFNWAIGIAALIGLSPGQVFYAGQSIKDGDPSSWFDSFKRLSESEALRGEMASSEGRAGQALLGSAYALRAAIQFCRVEDPAFRSSVSAMEGRYLEGARLLGAPIAAIEVPFEGKSLAGYFLSALRSSWSEAETPSARTYSISRASPPGSAATTASWSTSPAKV